MAIRIAVSCLAWLALFGSAEANIFFMGQGETAAAFLGSNAGPFVMTTRCDAVDTPPSVQRVPVGIWIHTRGDFFLGPLVSGIELLCERMNDAMARSDAVARLLAGRLADDSVDGAPYMRWCPTGQVLSGLTGRAGWKVDSVTIICSQTTHNDFNFIADDEAFSIGNPIFGENGSPDSSRGPADRFVRSIRVEFDSNHVTRMRVNCQFLLSTFHPLSPDLDLAAATRDQAVVFNGMGTDGFSVSVFNLGRSIAPGEATVRLTFRSDMVTITGPTSCTATLLFDTTRRITCAVPGLAAGARALISGFRMTPVFVTAQSEVGAVEVVAVDVDVDDGNDRSRIVISVPGIFWP